MLLEKEEPQFYKKKKSINYNGRLIKLDNPVVMGILNVTPDSFYEGSRYEGEKAIVKRAGEILEEGGDIIDIGGYSSRPGAKHITQEEELARLMPAVKAVRKCYPDAVISIDTFRSNLVERVVGETGSCIINDVSSGEMDTQMFETVARLNVPYILMHMKGTPANMQNNPAYNNVVYDIIMYFSKKVDELRLMGVNDIIIDPGFGFGKSTDHNYELLNSIDNFKIFQLPVLAGISRKSMIWKHLGLTPGESLNGTTVANTLALMGGADILRVHDVKEAVETINIVKKLKSISA